MKKSFHNRFLGINVLIAAVAATMALTACGDDSSTSPDQNVTREEKSSSSSVADSTELSSSSIAREDESSSSVEDTTSAPKARAATLDDLAKNYSLGTLYGSNVFLATGSKKGVFSLWVPDTAWVTFRSEFKDGVLEINSDNAALTGASSIAVYDSLMAAIEKGTKISLQVSAEDTLQFSVDGSDYKNLETAKVSVMNNVISDASKLVGVKLDCKNGESNETYTFYEGQYLLQNQVEGQDVWSVGYYDIQRSKLLMLPMFYNGPVFQTMTLTVDTDYNMTSATAAGKMTCEKSEYKYEALDSKKIVGEWSSSNDKLDWKLELKEGGEYQVMAYDAGKTVDLRAGSWVVYGDLLMLKNSTCMSPESCPSYMYGSVSQFSDKGFTYTNTDVGEMAMPSAWTAEVYEE